MVICPLLKTQLNIFIFSTFIPFMCLLLGNLLGEVSTMGDGRKGSQGDSRKGKVGQKSSKAHQNKIQFLLVQMHKLLCLLLYPPLYMHLLLLSTALHKTILTLLHGLFNIPRVREFIHPLLLQIKDKVFSV